MNADSLASSVSSIGYLAPDLVILDDFGLRRLTAQQSNDLYERARFGIHAIGDPGLGALHD